MIALRVSPALVSALLFCFAPSALPQSTATNALKVVRLSGSARERGLTHGRQLQREIRELVALWKADLKLNFGAEPDAFIATFLKSTDFTPAIERWTPELLQEVRGIAEGAALPFETLLAFQLADEVWISCREVAQRLTVERCSAVGVARYGTRPAMVAQNVDVEGFHNGFQTVLHIAEEGGRPEQFVFTFAGYLGANGMNRSIGICANALPHLRHGREGLPVAFIIRTVLEQKNGKSAIAFLKSIRHASGQNYVLGAGDSVYDFECSAGKVAPFAPVRGGGVVYHTNHPLANDDYDEGFIAHLKQVDPAGRAMDGTQARFAALERRLKNRKEGMRIEAIEEVLRSRDSERYPVCVPLRGTTPAFTFGSTIMQLSAEPEFRVSAGPPDVNAYQAFRFR